MSRWRCRIGTLLCGVWWCLLMPPLAAAAGTDEQATRLAQTLVPDYRPWFAPLSGAPSAELEPWFFALQAVLGLAAGAACLVLLHRRARAQRSGRRAEGRAMNAESLDAPQGRG